MTPEQIEGKIREFFEENYEVLRNEAGHYITGDIKAFALNQVLFYYRKLERITESVTETEVKLALPNNETPQGRNFTIEGVVDIVQEEDETWMYDIKTHDLEYVRANKELYEKQLNIYAHIWNGLRNNPLHHTAIISTSLPIGLKAALKQNDTGRINHEMEQWEPLVPLEMKEANITDLVADFAGVVDCIESGQFPPQKVEVLKRPIGGGTKEIFATRVCRNCDARFSCNAYRQYAADAKGVNVYNFRKFWSEPNIDEDQEDWMAGNLDAAQIEQTTNFADTLD